MPHWTKEWTKFIQNVQKILSIWIIFRQCVSFYRNSNTKKSSVGQFYTLVQKVHSEVFAQIALKISVKRAKGWSLKSHSADVPSGKWNFETGGKEWWKQKNSYCHNSINTNSMWPESVFTFSFLKADSCSQKEFLWCLRPEWWPRNHLQVETRGTTSTARSARNLTAHSKNKLKPQLWNSWRSNFEMQINQRQDWYRGRYRSLHLVSCWTVWVYHTLLQLFLSPGPLWPVGRCYAVSTETGNFSAGRIWITFLLAEISPCISDRCALKKKKKNLVSFLRQTCFILQNT